ncbi:MAG: hypothetical protein P9X24_07045 [Candidatus Hatepunaea meridiana]|nr:hypothetical protein [Candidatus Hatepunaea meridiana]
MQKIRHIIFLLILPVAISAQIKVSGEVSGVWTDRNSPYQIEDSTFIPADEELVIRQGVTVYFRGNATLYVYGSLNIQGTEEDTVILQLSHNAMSPWNGIYLLDNSTAIFNYTNVSGADELFHLGESVELNIDHSRMSSLSRFLRTMPGGYQTQTQISNSTIRSHSNGDLFDITRGAIRSTDCDLSLREPGNISDSFASLVSFTRCRIRGNIHEFDGLLELIDCDIAAPGERIEANIYSGGRKTITGCTIMGDVSISGYDGVVQNNHIGEELSIDHIEIEGGLQV